MEINREGRGSEGKGEIDGMGEMHEEGGGWVVKRLGDGIRVEEGGVGGEGMMSRVEQSRMEGSDGERRRRREKDEEGTRRG